MTVHTDYRTNRADYAIAATHGRPIADDGDREALLAGKKKSLWLNQQRSVKLAENISRVAHPALTIFYAQIGKRALAGSAA